MIELSNISYKFPSAADDKYLALNDISLTLNEGDFISLIGSNGSGKSTLAMIMAGVYKPFTGSVKLDGIDLSIPNYMDHSLSKIAVLFQNPLEHLVAGSVESDIAFTLENYGIPTQIIRQRVDESMKLFDLYSVRKMHPRELSGGEQQKVAFAGIWSLKPDYIICDEVTTYLDNDSKILLLDMLNKFSKNGGGVFFITQNPSETIDSDMLYIIENGKIIANGKPLDILSNQDILLKAGHYIPQKIEFQNRYNEIISSLN